MTTRKANPPEPNDLDDIARRASNALCVEYSEDAENMAQECLELISEVRELRQLRPIAEAAQKLLRGGSDSDIVFARIELHDAFRASKKAKAKKTRADRQEQLDAQVRAMKIRRCCSKIFGKNQVCVVPKRKHAGRPCAAVFP